LVENAIRHGLSKRASGGLIEIRARREMQNIKIEVNDNGYGTKDELLLGKGIGLTNTKERLAHLYGASHAFLINQDSGFSVSITIPYTT
jgi:sensor histidine kinase YesM